MIAVSLIAMSSTTYSDEKISDDDKYCLAPNELTKISKVKRDFDICVGQREVVINEFKRCLENRCQPEWYQDGRVVAAMPVAAAIVVFVLCRSTDICR